MTTSAEAQMIDAAAPAAVESVASTAAPQAHDEPKKKAPKRPRQDSLTKLQKRVESLQNKVEKLMEQNKRLKEEQKVLKSSYSRIHRIPK
jgi:Skp family chaperone for outer membrane proteins